MALGTDISISQVRTELGCHDNHLGRLCQYAGINRWSKCRPGYWYIDTSVTPPRVSFRAPRGGGYIDPRGADPETGWTAEIFRLGDFGGYKTLQEAPAEFVDGASSLMLTVNEGSGDLSAITYALDLGEVDWFNEEGLFRAYNHLGRTMTRIVLCHISGGQLVPLGNGNGSSELPLTSVVMSYGRKRYDVPLYVPSPAVAGQTVQYTVYPCLGDDAHIYGYFDTIFKTVSVRKVRRPYIAVIAMDESCAGTIFNRLSGMSADDTTLYGVTCTLTDSNLDNLQSGGTIAVAASNVSSFYLEGYPTHNTYALDTARWTYHYRIEVYDSAQSLTASGTGSHRAAVTGAKPAMQFTLPALPAGRLRHGDTVRIYFTDMGQTSVIPL